MGLDFIRRAAPTFVKSWNHGKTELAQPTLFTRYPECRTRSVVAQLNDGFELTPGTRLVICADATTLLLVNETTRIGVVETPPADLFRAIQQSGGCALGQVVRLNPLSRTVDVEVE